MGKINALDKLTTLSLLNIYFKIIKAFNVCLTFKGELGEEACADEEDSIIAQGPFTSNPHTNIHRL